MAWFDDGSSRVYYEETGSGPPVLLLPGFAGNIDEFTTLIQALASNYRVIAADLPGSGRSQPQPRLYPATYYEDDAHLFLAFLQARAAEPAHLMGFSDGGEVCLLMAALAPNAASSVVAWGAAGVIHDPEGHMLAAMYNVVDEPIPPLQSYSQYLKTYYGEANARIMTQSVVSAFKTIIEKGGDISLSKVSSITCPVLLMVGENDFIAPPDVVSQLASHIDTAKILKVEGAGHSIHAQKPDWFAETILDWLKKP